MGMNALEVRRRVMLAQPHEAVASGAVASFRTDVISPLPMQFDLLPVQDLHGYSNPWPAGGGENILPTIIDTIKSINTNGTWTGNAYAYNGVTYTINTDGAGNVIGISTSGTASADSALYLVSQLVLTDPCVINGCPSGGSATTYRIFATNIGSDTGDGVSKTQSGETTTTIRIDIKGETNASGLTFKPMIRLATVTDATFAPYENICPITGHDGFTRVRTGINIWDEEWEVGGINSTTGGNWETSDRIRSKNYIPVKQSTNYFLKSPKNVNVMFYKHNKDYISSIYYYPSDNNPFTTPANCAFVRFAEQSNYGTTYNHDISINYPSTDHDYHPYTGTSYSTTFPTPPGTVYGGHVRDNGNGTYDLTVGMYIIDMGDLTWIDGTSSLSNMFYALGSLWQYKPKLLGKIVSSQYKGVQVSWRNVNNGEVTIDNSQAVPILRVRDANFNGMTGEQVATALSGVQLVYELYEPIQYTGLTLTALQSLIGQNNVWVDNADSVSVEYWGH